MLSILFARIPEEPPSPGAFIVWTVFAGAVSGVVPGVLFGSICGIVSAPGGERKARFLGRCFGGAFFGGGIAMVASIIFAARHLMVGMITGALAGAVAAVVVGWFLSACVAFVTGQSSNQKDGLP